MKNFLDTARAKFALFLTKLRGAVRSKTIWFNALVVLALHNLPQIAAVLADQLPAMQPYLGPHLYQDAMLFVLVVNLYLRFKTSMPLEAK